MLDHGAHPDTPAAIDADGFGGHTALYGCVVSQPYRNGWEGDALARLLLDCGATIDVRASLRKQLIGVRDESLHEYRDVTPRGWGSAFHDQDFVNPAVMQLLAERDAP